MIKVNFKKTSALILFIVLGINCKTLAQNNLTSIKSSNCTKTLEEKSKTTVHKDQSFAKLVNKLGLTKNDIENARSNGKTLFDLAKEKGYTPDQVRKMAIEIKTDTINKAVTDGKISKEQGDTALKNMSEKISKWDGSIKSHKCGKHSWSVVLNQLGITNEEIANAKKSGKTAFDLAKEKKGMTPDQVKSLIIKTKTDAINKKVTEGKITREKGDLIISKVKSRVENWDGSFKS